MTPSQTTKKVKCSYPKCSERRPHYESQSLSRKTQEVIVPSNYEGKVYCSISCAVLDGGMGLKVKT